MVCGPARRYGRAGGAGARGTIAWVAGVAMLLAAGTGLPAQEKRAMPNVDEKQLLDQPQRIPALLAQQALRVEQVPNPHWRRDACQACHSGPATRAAVKLRDVDVNRSCNTCHDAVWPHSYIHPAGMKPAEDMQRRMSETFRQSLRRGAGTVTCATCHDVPMQCLPERVRERALNPLFLRGGPYKARTGICYQCHDPKQYERLNPHDQVADDGAMRENLCLVCHRDTQGLKDMRASAGLRFVTDDLSALCTGCHKSIPHPGGVSFSGKAGPSHFVAPSKAVAARMKRAERLYEISLPLDPGTGKVYCATCHNPHERGVVLRTAAAKGADSKDRLRTSDICAMCHEK